MPHRPATWPESELLTRLVREAHRCTPGAVDDLLTALRPSLLSFFASRIPDDGAEDLAQVTLLRVAGALPRIDPERADAYVATVARNVLRTAYRRLALEHRRRAPAEALVDVATLREPADVRLEYEELARAVHRVSASVLPPVLAEIVAELLRGETAGTIAVRQGVSPITIRTRLLRARAILRDRLQAYVEVVPAIRAAGGRRYEHARRRRPAS
jgi:RNA polymerase sigma-70 factor, ECF subfamily